MEFRTDKMRSVDGASNDEKPFQQESQQRRRSSIIRTATEPLPERVQYSPLSYHILILPLDLKSNLCPYLCLKMSYNFSGLAEVLHPPASHNCKAKTRRHPDPPNPCTGPLEYLAANCWSWSWVAQRNPLACYPSRTLNHSTASPKLPKP